MHTWMISSVGFPNMMKNMSVLTLHSTLYLEYIRSINVKIKEFTEQTLVGGELLRSSQC